MNLFKSRQSTIGSIYTTVASVLILGVCTAAVADEGFTDALKKGEAKISFRARYENVSEDNTKDNANALTNRTRLTFKSAPFSHWTFNVEVDNVAALTSDFNNTQNGKTNYSTVADPDGTDLNLANMQYANDGLTFVMGRQRINIDGQRFVGGVGWRQNEQTYDALLVSHQFSKDFNVAYAYIHNANRIFGPSGPSSDIFGDHYAVTSSYQISKGHTLGLTGLFLDPENAAAVGSTTVGLDYKGHAGDFKWNVAWATQSDDGDALIDYSADYQLLELTYVTKPASFSLGYEVLGSDDGVKAFTTPLATLHKFQGFADKFLATPNNGVVDTYFKVAGKAGMAKLAFIYHRFEADFGGEEYGDEIDLVANFKIDDTYSFLAKYASYQGDDNAAGALAVDTDKLWLMFSASY